MKKKSNKKKGSEFEDRVIKSINSGALPWQKGDASTSEFVLEMKYTDKKGFRISTKILEKLWQESLDSNKLPRLIIGIKDDKILWTVSCDITKGKI